MLQWVDNSVEARLEQLHYQGLRSGYQGGHNNCKVRGHRLLLATIRHWGGGKQKATVVWHSESFLTIDNGYQRKALSPKLIGDTSCCRLLYTFPGAHLRENRSVFLNRSLLEGSAQFTVYYTLTEVWLRHPVQEQQRKRTGIIPMSLLPEFLDYGSCAKK